MGDSEGREHEGRERAVIYCVVPRDLIRLHETLRRHFGDDPRVEVIVERRARDRRDRGERRAGAAEPVEVERRGIRNLAGRRVGDRRAPLVPLGPPELPRKARPHADRLVFVERLEPATEAAEDLDTARLVTRIQAGDSEAFSDLYVRYFDRVYSYLSLVLGDPHAAEDATQQVFAQAFEALPRYERRRQPFRAWLFVVVRNCALDHLSERARLDLVESSELNRRREDAAADEPELPALSWISDPDLMLFVKRLPASQRQVLLLRYMLDLSHRQIGAILGRREDDVRALQYRALRFLRARLTALGREAHRGGESRMLRARDKANVLRARRYSLLG